MDLQQLMNIQKEFDLKHQGKIPFFEYISDSNIQTLEHLIVCLVGEVGEVSNVTKKIARGDFSLSDVKSDLSEEITDVFIYLLKICSQLQINLEDEFIKKLEKNKGRFKKYEKS